MAGRDRDTEKYSGGPSTGNWKGAPNAKKKAEPKKAEKKKRGVATTEAVKKMKQKDAPKPRKKPDRMSKEDPKVSNAQKAQVKKVASKVATAKAAANKATRDTTKSDKSVTRKRKPLATGARSQNASGTGYAEGSLMDTLTRVRRGTYKPKKKAPPKKGSRKYMDQSA